MDLVGLGGAPDDLATWAGWLSDYGGLFLFIVGILIALYGLFWMRPHRRRDLPEDATPSAYISKDDATFEFPKEHKRQTGLRLAVHTSRPMLDAKPFLMDIQRHEAGIWRDSLNGRVPLQLPWVGVKNYVEQRVVDCAWFAFAQFEWDDARLWLPTNTKIEAISELTNRWPIGQYRLVFKVESSNAPSVSATFLFIWTGSIQTMQLLPA